MSAILTSGQPPGMRTKKGGGIGFMYDSPAPNNHVAIFGGASANNSDGSAKKDYPGKCSTVPSLISVCVSVLQFAAIVEHSENVQFHLNFHFNLQCFGVQNKVSNEE